MPIDINSADIQCALRSQNPVIVGNIPINHISFAKISSPYLGFSLFSTMLNLLCAIPKILDGVKIREEFPSDIKIICTNASFDKSYASLLVGACQLFFGKDPAIDNSLDKLIFLSDSNLTCQNCGCTFPKTEIETKGSSARKRKSPNTPLCIKCGGVCATAIDFTIDESNFDDVVSVLKLRNGLSDSEEDEGRPANEEARRLLEKRNEARKKLKQLKGEENGITLWELIDILASIVKIPYREIMEYDIFQFNTQFMRMRALDEYEIGIQQLLHGAKKEDVDLKHYLRKLGENQDD